MPGTSDQIIDASRDAHLRERLCALRPGGTREQDIWDHMTDLVSVDIGDGASIAIVFRYALGQAGLGAGARAEYVTDEHLTTALGVVFPQGA